MTPIKKNDSNFAPDFKGLTLKNKTNYIKNKQVIFKQFYEEILNSPAGAGVKPRYERQ
jgi:hypothetical protein